MLLIKNITVYDGTGSEGFLSDILVEGEAIEDVRLGITVPSYARVLDGTGLAAAPGFIDIHAHSEFSLLAEPAAPSKVLQGVTTEVCGNCGLSAAPLRGEAAEARRKELAELGVELKWSRFEEFFGLLAESRPAVNFATYCGHGNLRASVMGYADRRPDDTEMMRMEALLEEAMEAGVMGLSTGLIYPPGTYSNTKELARLARLSCHMGGIYTSHMRSEGARVVEAVEEAISIGREAGVPVQISHIKTAGPSNWDKIGAVIEAVEKARAEGVKVTADRYPYIASSTDLDAILPSWAYEGGAGEEVKRLAAPATRARLREEVLRGHPVPEYWGRVMISSVVTDKNRGLEGRTLAEAARMRGQEPVEALFDILVEEEVRAGAIYFSMSEDNLRKFLKLDWVMVGSDSTARAASGPTRQGRPHPRGFGSFPRIIGKYVREGVLTMPEAVRKTSAMAADKLHLGDRGYLKGGFHADIVIFDPAQVRDAATYEDPYQFPAGIKYVLVNGEVAVEDGRQTKARAGKILRSV